MAPRGGLLLSSRPLGHPENHQELAGAARLAYSKLVVEKGKRQHDTSRHSEAEPLHVRGAQADPVFVEDDLFKARKLSEICEIVFLIDHPYNKAPEDSLPKNLVRVASWQEIYRFVREQI
jgi:hypothetical protein